MSQEPVLSVVVAIISDTTSSRGDVSHLAECLDALAHQVNAPPTEIIVPYHDGIEGVDKLKSRFAAVTFAHVGALKAHTARDGGREHHDQLRAWGVGMARGRIVALLEDVGRPAPRWCENIVRLHEQWAGYAAIGGAIENGIDRPLNWAVYFCDFGRYQSPVPAGEALSVSDANVSYKRSALESIRPIWQAWFHETEVNGTLISRGEKVALLPGLTVYQHRKGLGVRSALMERFIWGRSYAATRSRSFGRAKRVLYAALSALLPVILSLRMVVIVLKRQRLVSAFFRALPLIVALTASWSVGELVGYFTGRVSSSANCLGDIDGCRDAS